MNYIPLSFSELLNKSINKIPQNIRNNISNGINKLVIGASVAIPLLYAINNTGSFMDSE